MIKLHLIALANDGPGWLVLCDNLEACQFNILERHTCNPITHLNSGNARPLRKGKPTHLHKITRRLATPFYNVAFSLGLFWK